MNNYVKSILNKFRTWKESKVSMQPLSAEHAYSLSSIGKNCNEEIVFSEYFLNILKDIKYVTRYHETDLLVHYPSWLCSNHKERLVEALKNLKYTVLFSNKDLVLISWKID